MLKAKGSVSAAATLPLNHATAIESRSIMFTTGTLGSRTNDYQYQNLAWGWLGLA